MQIEFDWLMLTWASPRFPGSSHPLLSQSPPLSGRIWLPGTGAQSREACGRIQELPRAIYASKQGLICAVHSILLNKSSGWHNKNMSPSWPRGGRGGFCLRTIPAPLLFSQAVHIPSPSLSPPLPFLSLHFYLFFFWKGAVKTGSCYVAVAGLVFTM